MISKSVVVGAAAAAICAVPIFSQHAIANFGHVLASGFYCEPDDEDDGNYFFDDGGFTRWTVKNGQHVFTFAGDDYHWATVGLRLDTANAKTGSIKFNYNTYDANDPHLGVQFTSPSTGFSFGIRFDFIGEEDWSGFGLTNNGFNFTYAPQTNSDLGPGFKYQTVWIYDVTWPDHSYGTQQIKNVTVDGVAVTPNTGTKTLYDCTTSRLPRAC